MPGNRSATVFDDYLSALDFSHSFLLASDVAELGQYRDKIDDELRNGRLDAAFAIYNLYQQRLLERTRRISEELTRPFDFKKDETYEADRKKAPWARTAAELDEIWRKRLKNETLSLMLAGKDEAAARDTLRKRYEGRLRRAAQSGPEDVFQIYMNAVTGAFDPHTSYLSPRNSENFNIQMRLSLEGIGAVLLEDGVFNQVGDGLTVYVRTRDADGTLRGILAHDSRDKGAPVTYLADRGWISITPAGPRATLVSGSRQEVDRATGRLRVLTFAESTLDLTRAAGPTETRYRDARERSLSELLDPPDRAQVNERDLGRFVVEAHQRFAQPLVGLSLVLVALAAVLAGEFSRRGNAWRVAAAVALGAGLIASGITVQNLAARQTWLIPLIWVHALLPGLLALWVLALPSLPARLRAARGAEQQAEGA